jgi:hypothetical protein
MKSVPPGTTSAKKQIGKGNYKSSLKMNKQKTKFSVRNWRNLIKTRKIITGSKKRINLNF